VVDLAFEPGLDALVEELSAAGRLVHVRRFPPRAARSGVLHRPLHPVVAERLPVGGLWSHQAAAIDHVREGRHTVVATGTASGKSRCFQLPIAEAIVDGLRPATSLLLFPTKALAQDQLRAFSELEVPGLVAATYDGDTPSAERSWLRANANVVLTNPEMLHHGLLPNHARWATFLLRLRYVVVDELHVLRGVFGTHVAHLLRRLRRLCRRYGSDPTFVFCSATIGEPGRLAAELCGDPVVEITDDGSPCGERLVALLQPPVVDERSGARTSTTSEAASLVRELVTRDHRVITFCPSRSATERLAAEVTRRLPDALAQAVRPYRSGYLPAERRQIEAELVGGRVRAVVATSALELGVDIGGLDATVLCGFPGTVASMWQQIGRAGRSGQQALAVVVAGEDQLDQWFVHHPEQLLERPPEPAVVNLANPEILDPHLACAAYESPLIHADERWWPELLDDGIRRQVHRELFAIRPDRRRQPQAVWAGRGLPFLRVGLRSAGLGEVRIVEPDGTLVGTVEQARAASAVHPGAVYLHRGRAWRVVELDLDERRAIVEPDAGDTYTQARSDTRIEVLDVARSRPVGRTTLHLGVVRVTTRVTGYTCRDARTRTILAAEPLELPPDELVTRAVWYEFPDELVHEARVAADDLPGALHAAEHAAIGMLPLFTICDRWDVGGVSIAVAPQSGLATVFIHDGYPGGAGVADLAFDAADRHLATTWELLGDCPCEQGCPSCVQSPKCGNGNEPLDKAAAHRLLGTALGRGLTRSGRSPRPTA
jgi:DEAD/DEAH box helicase domain-containing protein